MSLSPAVAPIVEEFPSKVVASFDSDTEAMRAASQLAASDRVQARQVRIVAPNDPAAEHKLQPEPRAIELTFFRTHALFGAIGLVTGVVLAAVSINWGPEALQASPMFTLITLTWVSTLFSLMVAGAVTLRMDHDLVLNHVLRASDEGRHSVVAHARSSTQKRGFANQLRAEAGTVATTL